MKKILRFFLYTFFLFSQLSWGSVEDHFNAIKDDPNALYAFLKEMPKGGELHYHLAGGAYPENMLAIAAKKNYCLNAQTLTMTRNVEVCSQIQARNIASHAGLYEKILRAWSMKDFKSDQETGHDHFFASFYRFADVVMYNHISLLIGIMERAAAQHELYLEIMIMPDAAQSTTVADIPQLDKGLSESMKRLLQDEKFTEEINHSVLMADELIPKVKKQLNCENSPLLPVCQLQVKFQYHILREQPLEQFFMQALHGFAAADKAQDIVGINIVQPEDGYIALRDYKEQMRIIHFLHQQYPKVHIALHAGELNPQAVKPEDLSFHIQDAIFVGQAERIGHGVDIAYEQDAEKTLEYMHDHHIAVEINLTSNALILGIQGKEHPLQYYYRHQVPIVLSTDDEGILRTDLTREYVHAVQQQHVDYKMLKQFTRNILTYSFLEGESIWTKDSPTKLVPACQQLRSRSCQAFAEHSQKASLQRQLELQLLVFEKKYH